MSNIEIQVPTGSGSGAVATSSAPTLPDLNQGREKAQGKG